MPSNKISCPIAPVAQWIEHLKQMPRFTGLSLRLLEMISRQSHGYGVTADIGDVQVTHILNLNLVDSVQFVEKLVDILPRNKPFASIQEMEGGQSIRANCARVNSFLV